MKLAFMLIVAVFLLGCAHHPGDCALGIMWDDCLPGTKGFERRQDREQRAKALDAAAARQNDMKCQSYGASPGSDAYVSCRAQLERK